MEFERDKHIQFTEENHRYTIDDTITGKSFHPKSVTTVIHDIFPSFDADSIIKGMMKKENWDESPYYGMSIEEIKNQWKENGIREANLGTIMHAEIETYVLAYPNIKTPKKEEVSKEFGLFLDFWEDFLESNKGYTLYRAEWVVFGDKIAGSIDCVLKNEKNEYILLDWKRSKEIRKNSFYKNGKRECGAKPFDNFENCNQNHYFLQLNFYRHILKHFYQRKVVGMYLVILHPRQDGPITIPVPEIPLETVWDYINNETVVEYPN